MFKSNFNRFVFVFVACLLLVAIIVPSASAQTFIVPIQNGGFDQGLSGWRTFALDQKTDNPDTSYWPPVFKIADDEQRNINGPTLQIDNYEFAKWRAGIYQSVGIQPGAETWFTTRFSAFTNSGGGKDEHDWIGVRLGIDPEGGDGCAGAVWGDPAYVGHLEQTTLTSPRVKANARRVTLCILGEPQYAFYKNALFLDDVSVFDPPESAQITDTHRLDTTLGSVCVWAFDDANANGARDNLEDAITGALFTLVDAQGQSREAESGSPACFAGLKPGVYSLRANDLKGYQPTTLESWTVMLAPGQTLDLPPVGFAPTAWNALAQRLRGILPIMAGLLALAIAGGIVLAWRGATTGSSGSVFAKPTMELPPPVVPARKRGRKPKATVSEPASESA